MEKEEYWENNESLCHTPQYDSREMPCREHPPLSSLDFSGHGIWTLEIKFPIDLNEQGGSSIALPPEVQKGGGKFSLKFNIEEQVSIVNQRINNWNKT